jgi:hypothetical protein
MKAQDNLISFVNVKTVYKKVEIKDIFGVLRFTVELQKIVNPEYHNIAARVNVDITSESYTCKHKYRVEVVNHIIPDDNPDLQNLTGNDDTVISNDDEGKIVYSKEFFPYTQAQDDFKLQVDRYKYLVSAETGPIQEINIVAKDIGYHIIDPQCCYNCKFCKTNQRTCDFHCYNPLIFKTYFNKNLDKQYKIINQFDFQPKVQPSGCCNLYEPITGPTKPELKLAALINGNANRHPIPPTEKRKIAAIIDNTVQNSVSDAMGNTKVIIENEINKNIESTVEKETAKVLEQVIFDCGAGDDDFSTQGIIGT